MIFYAFCFTTFFVDIWILILIKRRHAPHNAPRALDFGAKFQIVAFRILMGNGSPWVTVNSIWRFWYFVIQSHAPRLESYRICKCLSGWKKNSCSLVWYVPHVPRLECNRHYSHVNLTAFKDLHNNNTLPSVVPESQERWLFIPSIRYLVLLQLLTTND